MNERGIRVYADPSVYGGAFDVEYEVPTKRFFELIRVGKVRLIVNPFIESELAHSPVPVRQLLDEIQQFSERHELAKRALVFMNRYLRLIEPSEQDIGNSLHVALATVSQCDMLVSWKHRHYGASYWLNRYHEVNQLERNTPLVFCSPWTLIRTSEEDRG